MSANQISRRIQEIVEDLEPIKQASNEEIQEVIKSVLVLNKELKEICVRNAKFRFEDFERKWVAQSIQFTIDCIPEIHRILLQYYRRASELKLLDVGAGSGAGSNLIAALHSDRMIYSKIHVDAIDYIDKRLLWAKFQYPMINYQVKDLFDLPSNNWDLVFCSHCLEHIEDPHRFCSKLIDVCTGFAFIYTPYNEIERIQDHLNTFTEEFYHRYNVNRISVFNSMAWHADKAEDKVMLVTIDCRE